MSNIFAIAFYYSKFQFARLKFSDTTCLNPRTVYEKNVLSMQSNLKIINQANIRVNSYQVFLLTVFIISGGIICA